MSRSHRFVSGLVLTYGYQAILLITGIWLTPFYLGRIGQHDYGLWLVGTQLLTYLTLTDFGVVALLPQETAYATGRAGGFQRAFDLPDIVAQTVRIVLCQLPIVIAIASVMWFTIPAQWRDLRGPLAVILIAFIIGFPLRILPALLEGLQDLAFVNAMKIVVWLITTVSTVLMVLAGWSLFALAVGWLISQVISAPVCLYRLMRRFPGVLPSSLPPLVWNSVREHLGKGFWVSVNQVASMLVGNTDLLIIGRFVGPAAVVPYSCTGKLAGVLGNQATMLMHTAAPALCELKTGESRGRVFQALAALNQGMLAFGGFVFCVVVVINHWFVNWWVTAREYGGLSLTLAILITMLVRHWTTTTAYTVFCFGHVRRISLTNLADGVVSAVACLVAVAVWGIVGAPIGSIAGACLVSLPMNLTAIARDTDSTPLRLSMAMVGGWLWRFIVLGAASAWVAMHWSPRNVFEAAAAAGAVAAIYSMIMLPNLMKSPLGNYVRSISAYFRTRWVGVEARTSA